MKAIRLSVVMLAMVLAVSQLVRCEDAVADALQWLAQRQEADGHWDSVKYGAAAKNDAAVTSLALMAFLECGHSEKMGTYKENVIRTVAWLKAHQDERGKVADATDAVGIRDDGPAITLSTMALCEAAAMANVSDTRAAAQRAIDYCTHIFPMKETNAGGGKTSFAFGAEVDTLVAGWCIFAIKTAKVCSLRVNSDAVDAAMRYLDAVEHKVSDEQADGKGASIFWYNPSEQAAEGFSPYRVSAAALVGRQFLGWRKDELTANVALLIKQSGPPLWEKDGGKADVCYWWLATLCVFQQGGSMWRDWETALLKAMGEHQRRDGDFAGSWDPTGQVARDWGRVGQTALGGLVLEVYPIHPPIHDQ